MGGVPAGAVDVVMIEVAANGRGTAITCGRRDAVETDPAHPDARLAHTADTGAWATAADTEIAAHSDARLAHSADAGAEPAAADAQITADACISWPHARRPEVV